MAKRIMVFFAILSNIIFSGCRMAEVNPNAVCLNLCFAYPATYPFLRKVNLRSESYFEVVTGIASIDCFIYDHIQKEWVAVRGYWISYQLTGSFYPMVEKLEGMIDNTITHDEKLIILPAGIGESCKLKFVARFRNNTFSPRYCICNIDLQKKVIKKYDEKNLLFFDYAIYLPCCNVSLPQWDAWIPVTGEASKRP